MYAVFRTNRFKKDYKKISATEKTIVKTVVAQLASVSMFIKVKK